MPPVGHGNKDSFLIVFSLSLWTFLHNQFVIVCISSQVKAGFNKKTKCYEITTLSGCKKYEEVFIGYGPHDNQRLLLEYGFVAHHNPHSTVHVGKGKAIVYCLILTADTE